LARLIPQAVERFGAEGRLISIQPIIHHVLANVLGCAIGDAA